MNEVEEIAPAQGWVNADVEAGANAEGDTGGNGEVNANVRANQNDAHQDEEVELLLPPIMGMDDPRRMWLTAEEREWALDIKEVLESMPDLDNLSDFMYAQLALITKGNMEDAVNRAFSMQEFKREYQVQDTSEEGCRSFEKLFQLMPGRTLLTFCFSESDGTYVFAHDAKMGAANLNSPDKVDEWMRASYYRLTLYFPDFETIRKGIIILIECQGFSWANKPDFRLVQKVFSELVYAYPFNGQMRQYHTGMVYNLVVATVRQLLPSDLHDSFKTGLTFEDRLDTFFLTPDEKTANQRMLLRMKATLKRRYDHERTFVLDNNG